MEDEIPVWVAVVSAVASVLSVVIAWVVFLQWRKRRDWEAIARTMNSLGRRGYSPTPQERNVKRLVKLKRRTCLNPLTPEDIERLKRGWSNCGHVSPWTEAEMEFLRKIRSNDDPQPGTPDREDAERDRLSNEPRGA